MKIKSVFLSVFLLLSIASWAQNKKFDKTLKKIDAAFAGGEPQKALDDLKKFRSAVTAKLGATNPYMPGINVREAKYNLSLGLLTDFDNTLNNALGDAAKTFGENSKMYAQTLLQVGEMYNEYGNYRITREYVDKAKTLLSKGTDMDEPMKAKIAIIEAEAMIGQGFCNDAIELLKQYEKFYLARASDKETIVENGNIITRRVPEAEIFDRFNSYAKFQTLMGSAYAKKGRISVVGANEDNPDVDYVYKALESWLRGKKRFLGETSLAEVEYKYYWTKALVENGRTFTGSEKDLTFAENLEDLKAKTNPTNSLAQDLYLDYLAELLRKESFNRYVNIKMEYEKVIEKYFPKTTIHKINLQTVEFNSKLYKEKTRDLENQAINLLMSKSLPKNYKTRVRILDFLFDIAVAEEKYANAEGYLNEIVETKKELCGANSPEFHLAKLDLANFYLDHTNKIDEAGKIYEESFFKVAVNQVGEQHTSLLEVLNHIALWNEMTDHYSEATKTLGMAEKALRDKFDNKDILYAKELDEISKLQIKLGEYDLAEKNIKLALKIADDKDNKLIPEWRGIYIGLIETQARLYGIKGMFDEAQENLDESEKMISKSNGTLSETQSTADELIPLKIQLGKYSEAEQLLEEQIPLYEKRYGLQSLRLIEPLVNLSRIYLARGDYTEAERMALRANRIAIQTYTDVSTKTAVTQKLLSDIYHTIGDYEKAQDQVMRALVSQEKQFGRNHIEVAKSLSQLAIIRFHKGDNKKDVERLMLESREIMAEKLGKDNPQYAEILKNVAVLYISEKKFDIAFNSLTIAEGIWKSKSGKKNNINLASIYTLTGDVYYQARNYPKAEEFYNQARELYETAFSTKHPEYVRALSKLSKVYYMQKDYKRAKKFIEESLSNYEAFIKQFFPALSEGEKAKYWKTIRGDFEFYNTLAFSNLDDFRDLAGKVYNYQLLTKALLLSSSIKIRERIMNSTDEALKGQYSDWVAKKETLTLALSMSQAQLQENSIDPVSLQQEVDAIEKELSQKSELFGQSFESKRITFEEVKKSIKGNEVAMEMVRYRHFDHTFTDSVIYAAIYIRPDLSKPKVIMLKDGKKMETRFFKYYRNCIQGQIEDQYSYGVYWKPIQDVVGQASTIYLSADGIYNQINLEAIPMPEGGYIIDKANIILVSNTKDLFLRRLKSKQTSPENTASMFGNPTFYVSAAKGRQSIAALPGTEREVNQVQFMLKQKGWMTAGYMDASASEENMKGVNSPRIFHVATHGFYKSSEHFASDDEIETNTNAASQNPLLRTGLLLKGAGDLMEKTQYNFNMENGILTAYEAMSLNLDKTDLVVLSACETGLGELQAGEGVYGLQRAFLVAGAKVLIMSMFKVDDDATQQLMLSFYQKWLNSGNLRASFIDAKKELRLLYPEPIYWGAFMMIGLE